MYRDIKQELKRSWDLSFIVTMSLLLAAFIYYDPSNPVRIIVGIPFILFFPGYSLVASLFPHKNSMDIVGRVALSFGLSIALVSLTGFALNYTPLRIKLEPILFVLIIFNLIANIIGMYRRISSTEQFSPYELKNIFGLIRRVFVGGSGANKVINIVMAIAILSSAFALTYAVAVPKQIEHYSEFYVLGPNGGAFGYPNNLTVNQSAKVIIGISNHEFRTVNYTVEAWIANETFSDNVTIIHRLLFLSYFSVVLNHVPVSIKGNWTPESEQPYNFSVPIAGNFKIWFILQVDGTPFDGLKNKDYSNTPVEDRFLNMVDSDGSYSLNLNLDITA